MLFRPKIRYTTLIERDWREVEKLLTGIPGIILREDDTQVGFDHLLRLSPNMSFGAWNGAKMIGVVLSGCDGRRGYLYHMAVATDFRRRGIGARLAGYALATLHTKGAKRIHILVKPNNQAAISFWQRIGFRIRTDVELMSIEVELEKVDLTDGKTH